MIKKEKIWDYIIIGASPINILESAHLSSKNYSVLIIEKTNKIGGAWSPINIFNFKNIENAVHYFIKNKKAINFFSKNLKWNIIYLKDKYRIFNFGFLGFLRFHYDNFFGKIISLFYEKHNSIIYKFISFLKMFIAFDWTRSSYINGGANEIIASLKKIIIKYNINIKYNCFINKVYINSSKSIVSLYIKNSSYKKLQCRKLIISQGIKLGLVDGDNLKIELKKEFLLRPSIHILVQEHKNIKSKLSNMREIILSNDKLIKYIHNLNFYIKDKSKIYNKSIFVIALKHYVKYYKNISADLENILKKYKIINKNSKIINTLWSDIMLPFYSFDQIKNVKNIYPENIEVLFTENFTKGVELNLNKWKDTVKI